MITSKSSIEIDSRKEMRGGKGTVEIHKHIPAEAMQGKCRLAATLHIPPGASIGWHEHTDEYEIYIIQKGSGTVDDNGTEAAVGPGDAVLTGGGEGHAIANTGNEPMEVTAIILT